MHQRQCRNAHNNVLLENEYFYILLIALCIAVLLSVQFRPDNMSVQCHTALLSEKNEKPMPKSFNLKIAYKCPLLFKNMNPPLNTAEICLHIVKHRPDLEICLDSRY